MSTPNDDASGDLTVGAAARALGVSVRTLHHWDDIRLLRPAGRSNGGYRLYAAEDLARAQQVLVYRELGFSLPEIARILEDPEADAGAHLERQSRLLAERIEDLQAVAAAVERLISARRGGIALTAGEQVEIFGRGWQPEWQAEARERWGDTEAWRQSQDRTRNLTADDWRSLAEERDALDGELSRAARDGVPPDSAEAAALVERHRRQLSRFFDVPLGRQVILARMYTEDERFRAHYDAEQPGTAAWLLDAVAASARAQGLDPEKATWD